MVIGVVDEMEQETKDKFEDHDDRIRQLEIQSATFNERLNNIEKNQEKQTKVLERMETNFLSGLNSVITSLNHLLQQKQNAENEPKDTKMWIEFTKWLIGATVILVLGYILKGGV